MNEMQLRMLENITEGQASAIQDVFRMATINDLEIFLGFWLVIYRHKVETLANDRAD